MRKILLILIVMIIFTDVIHAAFPVCNNINNQIIQSEFANYQDPLGNIGRISLVLSFLGIILMILQPLLEPNPDLIAGYFLFGLLFLIIAFVLFVIWTTNKKWSRWFWLLFIALALLLPLTDRSESPWLRD